MKQLKCRWLTLKLGEFGLHNFVNTKHRARLRHARSETVLVVRARGQSVTPVATLLHECLEVGNAESIPRLDVFNATVASCWRRTGHFHHLHSTLVAAISSEEVVKPFQ